MSQRFLEITDTGSLILTSPDLRGLLALTCELLIQRIIYFRLEHCLECDGCEEAKTPNHEQVALEPNPLSPSDLRQIPLLILPLTLMRPDDHQSSNCKFGPVERDRGRRITYKLSAVELTCLLDEVSRRAAASTEPSTLNASMRARF